MLRTVSVWLLEMPPGRVHTTSRTEARNTGDFSAKQ
jgi:hypothetical protein